MNTEMSDHEMQGNVNALTRQWSDVLTPKESSTGTYMPIDYPPLLDMLEEAKRSSTGKTQSGKSPDAERSLLNLQAFALYEHIDGSTRAWLRDLSTIPAKANLKDALIQLAGLLQALHASHQIKEQRYAHIVAQFARWRSQIWQIFEPPTVKELLGKCPNCDETAYYNLEGGKGSALIAFYYRGLQPQARCQRCGEAWVGERELLDLGFHLGATMDEDVLREMGVI